MENSNVLNMRSKTAIFPKELKEKMVQTLRVENPEQTVDNVEHIICSHIVTKLREAATTLGQLIGRKISEKLGMNDE